MKAVEITKGIYWVGGIDWDLRNFHGYLTQRGSSYNAYLIIDEKITLIDTVKHYLADEMLGRIASVIDPKQIDVVISNHVEMDHSGALPKIMSLNPNATVMASPNGIKGLKAHYHGDWNFEVIQSGTVVNLGKRSLHFVLTPMLHWPDNMVSFMPEEGILFSNDAFGQHFASSARFDNEIPLGIVMEEAQKYYANIVMPYGSQVQKALQAVADLPIKMIAPSHGLIWKNEVATIVNAYDNWSSDQMAKKAVIVYDTMWGSTKKMANALEAEFAKQGYITSMYNLSLTHISDIMTDIVSAEYVCVGSPTLNNGMLPTVSAFLTYLKGLAPKKRKAVAFGSYGWGGQSVKQVEEALKQARFDVVYAKKMQYIPMLENLKQMQEELMNII